MKFYLALAILLTSNTVFAFVFPDSKKVQKAHAEAIATGNSLAKSAGNAEDNIKLLKKYDLNFDTYLAREQSDLDIMRSNQQALVEQYRAIDKSIKYYGDRFTKTGQLTSREEVTFEKLKAAKAKYDEELKIRAEDINQRQTLLEQQYNGYMKIVREEDLAAKAEEASRDIQNKITRGSHTLGTKMSELKYDSLTLDQTLNTLSNHYDQRIMGAYIKDKMARLLNSNALCLAATQCSGDVKKDNAVVSTSNMVEIFETTDGRSDEGLKSKSAK